MNCLDRLHIHQRVVQVHCQRCKLGNLGKRSLTRLLLLWASMTWKVVQVHSIGYRLRLSLPYLDRSHLDDWWCSWGCSNILVPTSYCFFFVFPYCSYPCDEENQILREEKKKERNEIKWTILTSTSTLFVTEIFSSRYWAKPPSC